MNRFIELATFLVDALVPYTEDEYIAWFGMRFDGTVIDDEEEETNDAREMSAAAAASTRRVLGGTI